MTRHLADRPRVVSVIGEPGYNLCPSVSSVVPGFTLARTNASIEAAELSGMTARRMRPDRVSRYFVRFRLGLAWLVPRSIKPRRRRRCGSSRIGGIEKIVVGPERNLGLVELDHALQRLALGIDHRSFCASNQAVLYVMPSWASNWSADMPLEWVAIRCAAQNHTVSGNLDRCITVPAVIDV
jgi:hypothetical protein